MLMVQDEGERSESWYVACIYCEAYGPPCNISFAKEMHEKHGKSSDPKKYALESWNKNPRWLRGRVKDIPAKEEG
jgi:hypothetical protein